MDEDELVVGVDVLWAKCEQLLGLTPARKRVRTRAQSRG
jgi:hypothetical protein